MRAVAAFAGGFALGAVLVLRMRPAPESSCCKRVVAGVRDEVGAACGSLAELCHQAGDAFGIYDNSPALLDLFGV